MSKSVELTDNEFNFLSDTLFDIKYENTHKIYDLKNSLSSLSDDDTQNVSTLVSISRLENHNFLISNILEEFSSLQ